MLKNLLGSCEVKLPGAEFATVDIGKLREYCLNPNHLGGGHKCRVFAAALNLTQSEAELLRDELLRAAREVDATEGVADQYGSQRGISAVDQLFRIIKVRFLMVEIRYFL